MKTQLQLILIMCIVYFKLTSVQLYSEMASHQVITSEVNGEDNIQENFQNLFKSIILNNTEKSENFREILEQELGRERQTFGAMKEQLWIVRNRNAHKIKNFYERNHISDNVVAAKREILGLQDDIRAYISEALENVTAKPQIERKNLTWVLMVCNTNQCRSPIAAAVFKEMIQKKGLEYKWGCDSAGTWVNSPEARWPMDARAKLILNKHGIMNVTQHAARPVEEEDYYTFDYMLGMDTANVEDLTSKAPNGSRAKIELLSSYDPLGTKFMRHPYRDDDTTGFEECYKISVRSLEVFIDKHP